MRLTVLLLAAFTLFVPREASAASADTALFSRIRKAWQARQERCQSGIIRWKQDEFYEKGAWGSNDRIDSILVKRDFAFKKEGLCIYSLDGPRWNLDKNRFDDETLQEAIYHGEVKTLFAGQRHGRFPAGWICKRETLEHGENYEYEVPLLTFRPLAAGISWFNLDEWDVVSASGTINSRRCVHLVRGSEHLWLDLNREYLPVRHDWLTPTGKLYGRLDTDYAPHEVMGWAPQTWRYIRTAYQDRSDRWHQKVTEGFTATVTEIQLNVSIPDAKFDIKFPPGTRVRNEKTEQIGIIREDGSFRPVELEERLSKKSWDELMHSDPPSEVKRRARIRFWLLAIGIANIVSVFYWFYGRRRSL